MAIAPASGSAGRTDEQIQRDVLAELKWDAHVRPNEIGVAVKDGIVTLSGTVDAYSKRWAAEKAAHRVRGVKAVANEIEVQLPTSSQRTDEDIARSITAALEWDTGVPLEQLDITVSKGWVTLRGTVEWQYQREDAERAVSRIAGVTGVTNLIQVEPRLSASGLKEKIEQALLRRVKTDAERVENPITISYY